MRVKILTAFLVVACITLPWVDGAHAAANRKPTVTAFDLLLDTSPSPIAISTFTASDPDNNLPISYLVTETSATPAANNPNWSTTQPSNYTTSSTGTITLYAWAKDSLNAISTSLSHPVTVPAAGKCLATVAESGGDFTNIQDAIDSASIASAGRSHHCLVKILPGYYDLQSGNITLKPNVDLEGSGVGSTVITSIVAPGGNPRSATATAGTLIVPSDINATTGPVTVRNLKVTNTYNAGAVAVFVAGLVNLENVTAIASGTSTTNLGYAAVLVVNGLNSAASAVSIKGGVFAAEGGNTSGDNVALICFGTGNTMTVDGAELRCSGGSWCSAVLSSFGAKTEVRNSVLSMTPSTEGGTLVEGNTDSIPGLRIMSSRMSILGPNAAGGALTGWDSTAAVVISNSEVHSSNVDPFWAGTSATFAASLLDTLEKSNYTLVNCWDANYQPIPNQIH